MRLPGGEILGKTVELSQEELALGEELLGDLQADKARAHAALAKISIENSGFYSLENGNLASVIVIPRPDFELARQIRTWPAGDIVDIKSDQPLRVRTIYPPDANREAWRIASVVEPSPDYRYQSLDVDFAEFERDGHRLAVTPWQPAKT